MTSKRIGGIDKEMYVELHCHSAFSFLDGASLPEELVQQALKLNMKALALTDHNGLYGSMEFAQAAKAWGIQAITGAEVTLTDESHVVLLVENDKGYANLCRLLSRAHLDHPRGEPKVSWELLCRHHEGLILLTGCRLGPVAKLVDQNQMDEAKQVVKRYLDVFGKDNLWIELQQNFVRGDTVRIRRLIEIAKELHLGIVATNNVHYHERSRHRLHDVLTAIKHNTTLDASHRLRRANAEFYLKSPQQMRALFAELPQAIDATVEIAERCSGFDLTADLGYSFPDFESDLPHDQGIAQNADERLAQVCWPLLKERYGGDEDGYRKAGARLQQELDLIKRHGLGGFFLVYRDLLRLAEEVADQVRGVSPARKAARLPPGRGRGSSVSSLVCYLIGLSHVDPIQSNLAIDRFLNDELHSVPDIDLDFARDIREQLILRVYEHYGQEYAALVCSFVTYRLRSAVRDIGKVLGLPADALDRLAKLSDGGSSRGLRQAMLSLPEFKNLVDEPLWRDLIQLAEEISGFPRHISQHVGGMIISSRPLVEFVPLEKARMPGRVVCQWDKDSCEDAGFIKVDFLALGMLSLVEECVELIALQRAAQGLPPLDLSRIPMDDPAVYDMICAGDTIGVFQIESRAQIQLLPRTQPRNLDELAIEIAIIRPGPIIGGAVHPYVERRTAQREAAKRGETYTPPYDHPLLEPVLEETLGVILYQDHVLQTAVALAGFTPGQAERLRRALGRKNAASAVAALQERFRQGAAEKGVSQEVADHVFMKLLAFSQFGFPKSHSVAFAVLAYQSAWLKLYYPAEYTAAIFNSQPMGFYPPHVLVRDAQRRGVTILEADINRSQARCSIEDGQVRIGFNYVKGISDQDAEKIIEERNHGPFTSVDDFMRRVDLPRDKVEKLIAAGVFRSIGTKRRDAMWQAGLSFVPESIGGAQRQMSLPLAYAGPDVALPPMTAWEEVVSDYDATGLTVKQHLIGLLRPRLKRQTTPIASLGRIQNGKILWLAGLITARQRPETAKGVIFLLIEDETGMLNVVVRPNLYERKKSVIRGQQLVMVRGKLQRNDGVMSVLALDVWPLSDFVDGAEAFFTDHVTARSHDFH